ncbi:glycoside hydrolase domain-containing protein [Rhodanobacter lindaniclasticus]
MGCRLPVWRQQHHGLLAHALFRHLTNGKDFTVSAAPLDDAHPWVGEVTLNGKPLAGPFLHHAQILAGGELHFRMQATPNRTWGVGAAP